MWNPATRPLFLPSGGQHLTWVTFCRCLSLSTTKMSILDFWAMSRQTLGELVDKSPTEKPLEAEAGRTRWVS